GEAGAEDGPKSRGRGEGGRLCENGTEAVSRSVSPDDQRAANDEEKRGAEHFEPLDRVHAANDDRKVDRPQNEEGRKLPGGYPEDGKGVSVGRIEVDQDGANPVDGGAAKPGLDAGPTAGAESAEERRDVGAARAEGGAEE